MGDLHSYKRNCVWKVFLEELDDLVTCCELLKLFKGHEESAGKRLVLVANRRRTLQYRPPHYAYLHTGDYMLNVFRHWNGRGCSPISQ